MKRSDDDSLPSKSAQPRALRLRQACEALSVSRSTLFRMARRGQIHIVRFGRCSRVPLAEVERLIRGGNAA